MSNQRTRNAAYLAEGHNFLKALGFSKSETKQTQEADHHHRKRPRNSPTVTIGTKTELAAKGGGGRRGRKYPAKRTTPPDRPQLAGRTQIRYRQVVERRRRRQMWAPLPAGRDRTEKLVRDYMVRNGTRDAEVRRRRRRQQLDSDGIRC